MENPTQSQREGPWSSAHIRITIQNCDELELAKQKKNIFCTTHFALREFFLRVVLFLNEQCIEYTSRICILLHIKKNYLIHFSCLFLKLSKGFSVSWRCYQWIYPCIFLILNLWLILWFSFILLWNKALFCPMADSSKYITFWYFTAFI